MAVLVGKQAPDFTANAVLGNNEIKEITFSKFTKGKYAVVFLLPARLYLCLPVRTDRFRSPSGRIQEAQR